jgi:hypothetical protein
MTTAKTAHELENLVITEMLETCPECANITGAVILPSNDPHGDGNWDVAELIRGGATASPNCHTARLAAVARLRRAFHLMAS